MVAQNQREILRKRCGMLRPARRKQIVAAARGLDVVEAAMGVQLISEIADMDVDRAIECPQLSSRYSIGEVSAGGGPSRITDQDLKQSELDGCEVQRGAVDQASRLAMSIMVSPDVKRSGPARRSSSRRGIALMRQRALAA